MKQDDKKEVRFQTAINGKLFNKKFDTLSDKKFNTIKDSKDMLIGLCTPSRYILVEAGKVPGELYIDKDLFIKRVKMLGNAFADIIEREDVDFDRIMLYCGDTHVYVRSDELISDEQVRCMFGEMPPEYVEKLRPDIMVFQPRFKEIQDEESEEYTFTSN